MHVMQRLVDQRLVDQRLVDQRLVDQRLVDARLVDERLVDQGLVDQRLVRNVRGPTCNQTGGEQVVQNFDDDGVAHPPKTSVVLRFRRRRLSK